jgi:tetratricopeptide (TPR) repeat protein
MTDTPPEIHNSGDVNAYNLSIGGTQIIYYGVQPPQPDKPQPISVFLSYARKDDDPDYDAPTKSFMRRLFTALTAVEFIVWWDRVSLPARSLAFTKEIEDAIRACDRFVLVVGPGVVDSEYVTSEWQFAVKQCKPVTPILRAGNHDLTPAVVAQINTIDCRPTRDEAAALQDLIARLRQEAPLGNPFGVKSLPQGYITRETPFNAARDALCADAIRPTVISSAPPSAVALYGLGGIGKSTLAAALSGDCQVRRHFRDGILWVTVGQNPSVLDLQASIGVHFGDNRENYQTEQDAIFSLSRLLCDKAALLVLDDVWDHSIVERFPVGGTACRLLITTRSGALAHHVSGEDIRLDLLTPDEGARLLAGIAGGDDSNPVYRQITEKLGGHTLAVSLAARQIANHYADDAADMLRLIEKRAAEPTPFLDLVLKETDKDLNLALSLSLSYNALPDDDLRRRFYQTGIFSIESRFDRAMVAAVWEDTDEDEARHPLQILVGAGLLDAEPETGRYTQHRLLHAYACALLKKHGEEDETAARHFAYYETVHGENRDHTDTDYLQSIASDLPNVIQALEWGFVNQPERGCDWLSTLDNFFQVYQPEAVYAPLLEQARQTAESAGYKRGLANTLQALGDLSVRRAELDAARAFYDRALPLYEHIGDRLGLANTLMSMGDMLVGQKSWADAASYYQRALPIARQIQSRLGVANILYNYGLALFEMGHQDGGLDALRESVQIFEAIDPRRWAQISQRRLIELLHRAGRSQEAASLVSGGQPTEEEQAAEAMQMLAAIFEEKGADAIREMLRGQAPDDVIEQIIARLAQGGAE